MENVKKKNIYVTFVEALHHEIKTKGNVDLVDVIKDVFDEETAEFIINEVQKSLDEYKKHKEKEKLTKGLKEVVIQSHLGDPKARKIIDDIEELAEKENSQSAANTPATVGK